MLSLSECSAMPRACRSSTVSISWRIAREPVKLPHDQGISRAEVVERGFQLRPVALSAAGLLDKHARAASGLECVGLQRCALVERRDARVSDKRGDALHASHNYREWLSRTSRGTR